MKLHPAVICALLTLGILAGTLYLRSAPRPTTDDLAVGPFLATTGTIYTDTLFLGLLSLESSPTPATREQAGEILRIIALLENKLRKNQYYDTQLVSLLTPAQVSVVEAQGETLTSDRMNRDFNPESINGIVDELEAIAGSAGPTAELEMPADVGAIGRPGTVSRMTCFVLSWRTTQDDPALRIDRRRPHDSCPTWAAMCT